MSTIIQNPDYFLIGQDNYTAEPYSKNTAQKLGGYKNRSHTVWEAAFKIDYSSIPSGATIDSVSIEVNIVSNDNGNATDPLQIRQNDKVTWVDNGVDEPSWSKPTGFDDNNEFTNILSGIDVDGGAVGVFTIPSSTNLVSMVQDQFDGTIDPNYGFMLTYYTDYYAYYCNIDSIEVTIDYSGGATARRPVMIIS